MSRRPYPVGRKPTNFATSARTFAASNPNEGHIHGRWRRRRAEYRGLWPAHRRGVTPFARTPPLLIFGAGDDNCRQLRAPRIVRDLATRCALGRESHAATNERT